MKRIIVLALSVASVLVLNSCINNDNPLAAALSSGTTTELNKVISASMADFAPPGLIVGVWSDENGQWVTARGLSNTDGDVTMTPTMSWRAGELTESFIAAMILQMVSEDKLKLDTKLNSFYEEFPNSENITISNLLSHTSGLADMNESPKFRSLWGLDTMYYYHPDSLLLRIALGLPQTELGAYKHANTNYFILGRIIEMISQRYIENQISDRIFDFISLDKTTFPTNLALPEPYTNGYIFKNGKFEDNTLSNISLSWASGSMVSNAYDLNHWLRGLMQGTTLQNFADLRNKMLTPVASDYGYGVFCGNRIGSCGTAPGYSTSAFFYKDIKSTVVVMANVSESGKNIADSIAIRISDKLKQLFAKE